MTQTNNNSDDIGLQEYFDLLDAIRLIREAVNTCWKERSEYSPHRNMLIRAMIHLQTQADAVLRGNPCPQS